MRSLAIAVFGLVLTSFSTAAAEEVGRYHQYYGWQPGQGMSSDRLEGLEVSFTIEESTNAGRMYVRAQFCNLYSSETWVGGIRVTTNEPTNAHATLRVPGGECRRWSEHLEYGAERIYILARREDRE